MILTGDAPANIFSLLANPTKDIQANWAPRYLLARPLQEILRDAKFKL